MTRVSAWLKGRISWWEVYNLPIGVFHYLDCLVLNEMKSEEGRKNKEAEQVSDAIENGI